MSEFMKHLHNSHGVRQAVKEVQSTLEAVGIVPGVEQLPGGGGGGGIGKAYTWQGNGSGTNLGVVAKAPNDGNIMAVVAPHPSVGIQATMPVEVVQRSADITGYGPYAGTFLAVTAPGHGITGVTTTVMLTTMVGGQAVGPVVIMGISGDTLNLAYPLENFVPDNPGDLGKAEQLQARMDFGVNATTHAVVFMDK